MRDTKHLTITREEALQARALLCLAHKYRKILDELEIELTKIVEPEEERWCGHTSDTIYEPGSTIEGLFEKLGIEFEN